METLSKRQFTSLCNEVAGEGEKIWEQSPRIDRRTALLKRLVSKLQSKLGVESDSSPADFGVTPAETSYRSALAAVCNTLTFYGKVAIAYDCTATIQQELFGKVKVD